MTRRAIYMYGADPRKGPDGQIGAGLGMTNSTGSVGLIPPTVDITHTGQEETIDGVRIVFQLTPGTEAPAEMNFLFPRPARPVHGRERHPQPAQHPHAARRAGPRRPGLVAVPDRGDRPLRRRARRRLRLPPLADLGPRPRRSPTCPQQRDLYAYLHDQTLRLLNAGLHRHRDRREDRAPAGAGGGLARPRLLRLGQPQRQGDLPALPGLVRRQPGLAVGAPAGRRPRPATSTAWAASTPWSPRRRRYADDGDLRFAAQLLNHAVFADPDHPGGQGALADTLRTAGHGAENGTWRNFYLIGRHRTAQGVVARAGPGPRRRHRRRR